jgi:hypothetical protein
VNWQAILVAFLPQFLQLLQSPAFASVAKLIEDDLAKKIAAGAHPDTATQQASGQLFAAGTLHLTGNLFADARSFVTNFKPPPTPTPSGYTS